ncbi:hypothetical protein FG877_02130 [Enterococcus casseliflavus]|nr:hypothetical protein [Enterococcus casseliflavus]
MMQKKVSKVSLQRKVGKQVLIKSVKEKNGWYYVDFKYKGLVNTAVGQNMNDIFDNIVRAKKAIDK